MLRDGPGGLPDGSLVYRFGGWFGLRWVQCLARQLAHGASADGSTYARRRARRLAYIISIRDRPGGLPDGSFVSLWWICASPDGSIRDGPGIIPDSSLAALRRMVRRMPSGLPDGLSISFRFETGPAACPTACSCRYGRSAHRRMIRIETDLVSCPTARWYHFGGFQFETGPASCLTVRSCITSA